MADPEKSKSFLNFFLFVAIKACIRPVELSKVDERINNSQVV